MAANAILVVRGIDPGTQGHMAIKMRSDEAVHWIEKVASGLFNLSVTSTTPARKLQGVISVIQPTNSDGTTTRGW